MLNKENNQDITGISNSSVNQAGGDVTIINNGVQLKDIVPLVDSLVAKAIDNYVAKGLVTVKNRRDEFGQGLLDALKEKAEDRLFRFDDPSVQYSTRRAALGYIKTGDKEEGEELIDMLIEKLYAEEYSTQQNVIDQAIEVLPTLSRNAITLLILMAFRNLTFSGRRDKYIKWLKSIDPVVNACDTISPLDIAFLQQANCSFGVNGIYPNKRFEEELLNSEDLFFRHDITGGQYEALLKILGFEGNRDGISIPQDQMKDFAKLILFMDIEPAKQKVTITICNSTGMNAIIDKPDFDTYRDKIRKVSTLGPPFTEAEVKRYLISLNSHWENAIDLLNREDVRSVKLTLLGNYIASRQLSKLSGQEIGLDVFYSK